jgi:uncharacterized delta-60 repeat protein
MKKYQVFSSLLVLAIALVACPTPEVKPPPPVPASFALSLALSKMVFKPNGSAPLTVNVERLAGFAGDIIVGLNPATLGFTTVPITIKNPDTSGVLSILTAAAPGSSSNIGIQASSGANAVTNNVVGQVLPFTTTLFDSDLVIAAGTSITTKVLLGRSQGYSDPVTVTLTGLPTGVTSSGVTIPANTTSGDLVLTANKTAPATTTSVPLTLTTSSGVFEETWSATITVIIKPGTVLGNLNRSTNSVASNAKVDTLLQSDGKLVTFGTLTDQSALPVITQTMTRWNSDATLDTTFGTGGTTTIVSSGNSVTAMQKNSNGDYLISSRSGGEVSEFFKLTLWRFNSAGVPVLGFGTNGKLIIEDPSMSKNFFSAVLLPNAKIIIIGEGNLMLYVISATGFTGVAGSSSMYQKLNADGTPDTTFGTNGTLLSNIQTVTSTTRVNKKGKILSDGSLLLYNCSSECFRIDPVTGSRNTGIIATPDVGNEVVEVLEYNNKIHLVIMDFGIIRLNTNGSIDDTYSPRMRGTFGATFGADGSLVLLGAGASDIQTASNDAAIQRFTPNGQPDLSFGTAGRATIPREGSDFNLIARHGTITGNTLTIHGLVTNSGFTQFNVFNARVKY